jgi:hypothetical protein
MLDNTPMIHQTLFEHGTFTARLTNLATLKSDRENLEDCICTSLYS